MASRGILFARLDQPAVPRGRKASRKDVTVTPILTAVFYGPSDDHATKLVLSFVPSATGDPRVLERWVAEDVLADDQVVERARAFIQAHPATGISVTGGTVGCPHEEGKDYPTGGSCPRCPFWKDKP